VHYIKAQVKGLGKVTHFLRFREMDLWIPSRSFVL